MQTTTVIIEISAENVIFKNMQLSHSGKIENVFYLVMQEIFKNGLDFFLHQYFCTT